MKGETLECRYVIFCRYVRRGSTDIAYRPPGARLAWKFLPVKLMRWRTNMLCSHCTCYAFVYIRSPHLFMRIRLYPSASSWTLDELWSNFTWDTVTVHKLNSVHVLVRKAVWSRRYKVSEKHTFSTLRVENGHGMFLQTVTSAYNLTWRHNPAAHRRPHRRKKLITLMLHTEALRAFISVTLLGGQY